MQAFCQPVSLAAEEGLRMASQSLQNHIVTNPYGFGGSNLTSEGLVIVSRLQQVPFELSFAQYCP